MSIEKVINYWEKGAKEAWQIAGELKKLKHYSASLFYCHLAIEKILKGLIVKRTGKHAPYLHELDILSRKVPNLSLSNKQVDSLKRISAFNIAGRYDDIKYAFHKACTIKFTEKYYQISKELYLWLKKQYHKK